MKATPPLPLNPSFCPLIRLVGSIWWSFEAELRILANQVDGYMSNRYVSGFLADALSIDTMCISGHITGSSLQAAFLEEIECRADMPPCHDEGSWPRTNTGKRAAGLADPRGKHKRPRQKRSESLMGERVLPDLASRPIRRFKTAMHAPHGHPHAIPRAADTTWFLSL